MQKTVIFRAEAGPSSLTHRLSHLAAACFTPVRLPLPLPSLPLSSRSLLLSRGRVPGHAVAAVPEVRRRHLLPGHRRRLRRVGRAALGFHHPRGERQRGGHGHRLLQVSVHRVCSTRTAQWESRLSLTPVLCCCPPFLPPPPLLAAPPGPPRGITWPPTRTSARRLCPTP